jgi:hypothetical protein
LKGLSINVVPKAPTWGRQPKRVGKRVYALTIGSLSSVGT